MSKSRIRIQLVLGAALLVPFFALVLPSGAADAPAVTPVIAPMVEQADEPAAVHQCPMMGGAAAKAGSDPTRAEMMEKHEKLAAELKAMDAKLESLVAAMNATKGNARVDAVVAVVNEMATQRGVLRDIAMSAGGPGMGHGMMMGHGSMHGEMVKGGCCQGGEGGCKGHGEAAHGHEHATPPVDAAKE